MYNRRMDNICRNAMRAWSLLIAAAFIGGCAGRLHPCPKSRKKAMKRTILSTMTLAILVIAIAVAVSQATAIGQGHVPDRSLGGVWLVEITPRNCATGEPILTAVTKALYTFHDDGMMSVSFVNNSFTLERTAAHGLWRRDLGWEGYSFKFIHYRRNVSTGAFAGKQEGAGALVLAASGDEFTTDGSSQVFDVNDNPVGTGGCSNSVGTRFKLEP
jgi:hypothetical protein